MHFQSNSIKQSKFFSGAESADAIFQEEHVSEPFASHYTLYKQSWRTKQDLHYHNYPECGLCLKGDGLFFVEDRIYPFSAGTVVFFPVGMQHIAQSPAERNSLWEYIWLDAAVLNLTVPTCEVIVHDKNCASLFNLMRQELKENGNREIYVHLCAAFFGKLHTFARSETGLNEDARQSILPAIQLIAAQYNEPINAAQLAKICSLSESTLRRNFQTVTGQSPMEYVNSVRLMMAEQLLVDTSLTILEISERCGFLCLSTFNRQFLKRHGISPREYRRQR
ncbi:MAG: helix-turn-helix transcriptional regulator [Clostridia bacterium]|nr:helix-turn-helix transcriptional regulator [Clostridia bacterium]